MRIVVGADDEGEVADAVVAELCARGHDVDVLALRRWSDANVLVTSLERTSPETAREILGAWFAVEGPDADEAANIARLAELERRA
jgi:ribose 5-phosphate isomerase RpiB